MSTMTPRTDSDEHHVFFRQRGIAITPRGFIHVAVTLNLADVEENLRAVHGLIMTLTTYLAFAQTGGGLELGRLKDEGDKLLHKISAYRQLGQAVQDRDKRQLDILLGLAGTLWGAYNTYQINQLEVQLGTQATAISDLFHEAAAQRDLLSHYGLVMKEIQDVTTILSTELVNFERYKQAADAAASMVEAGRMQVQDAGAMLDSLMDQRLSVTALNPQDMAVLLRSARKKATEMGFQLIPKTASDAYQCQATFRLNGSHVTAIIHLPLTGQEEELQVLEYVPVPLEVEEDVYMTVLPEHTIIATDSARSLFVTMPLTTLATCTTKGAYFLCPEVTSRHRRAKVSQFRGEKDAALCTWFLLTEDLPNVKKA